ncbi:Putative C6 zinc finger domain protein [Penicillium brasilianum]|uniref:Putative C6 zinc finger domain protein n=1 Tax=Penicillium brasilianum TaxID=104259 RepID=A0A0F7TJ32_PENBI|nr:Putative C6 zinc finger domain protein [Penicillium brasilianum]
MPRPRRPGAPEPKRRSRKGCWPCKARKVKCGEEKPSCLNCQRQGEPCDYSVRLNWGGRTKRSSVDSPTSTSRGHGGTLIGFAEPMRISAIDSADLPASILSGNKAPADGFINFRSGDLGSPGALSPNSAAAFGVFDSPKPQVISDHAISSSQGEVQFATTWAEHSPATPASSGSMSQYSFGQTFHNSFSPAADQGVGLRSLSAFAFHSSSVSQPVSFLRNSVDMTGHPSDASSQPGQIDAQISTSRSLPHDDHGLSFLLNDPVGQDGPSHEMTGHGGVSTMLLPRSHASLSPSHDRHTPGSNHAQKPESLHSLHHSEILSADSRDKDTDHPGSESHAAQSKWQAYLTSVTDNYGLDSGRPDRDLTLNNDHAAIDINSAVGKVNSQSRDRESFSPTSFPGLSGVQTSDFSGYYASPVPINIPRYLSPLPSSLLKNPINLLYFHHFLNHTSKMLVPHDCDNNPFVSVLPSMAISDPNLLNLVLAYSASHRARYLGHAEPVTRIAHWVSDVFPALRVALEASKEEITDSHLATAILLLSLKIVCPGTFEVPIPWQSHLKLARDLFIARSDRIAMPGNRIGAFFARWLGYIDTMGALSCRQAGPPLMLYHSVLAECCRPQSHDEYCVDCFTGFSPRTGFFLLRLAQLVQQCDNERFDDMGNFQRGWHPSADMVMEAQAVLGDFDDLNERVHADPDHHLGAEADDMMATEEAFRCAGLLHLHRRVLESSPDSFPVQDALRKLVGALDRMRLGASTEVCSLLPLFTAGCESRDSSQRMKLLNRFFVLEKSGMKQIQNARQLMQHCWDDNLPWIALAEGEFLG